MRDLTLITKEPLEVGKCLEQIKTLYKGAIGNDTHIRLGKPPRSLYIWLPSTKKYDPNEYWDEEELKDIPNEYNYFTGITFHLTVVSKNLVKLLKPLYPDMIIEDEDGKLYSIEEYLNAEFDY